MMSRLSRLSFHLLVSALLLLLLLVFCGNNNNNNKNHNVNAAVSAAVQQAQQYPPHKVRHLFLTDINFGKDIKEENDETDQSSSSSSNSSSNRDRPRPLQSNNEPPSPPTPPISLRDALEGLLEDPPAVIHVTFPPKSEQDWANGVPNMQQTYHHVPTPGIALWMGESHDDDDDGGYASGNEMHLFPWTDNHDNQRYLGRAVVEDLVYDIRVMPDGYPHMIWRSNTDFDKEEDPFDTFVEDMLDLEDLEEAIDEVTGSEPESDIEPTQRGTAQTEQEEDEEDEDEEDLFANRRGLLRGGGPRMAASRALQTWQFDESGIVTLRIIVPWTEQAECAQAGLPWDCATSTTGGSLLNADTHAAMRAHAELAVTMTNAAFSNSGILIRLQLAAAYRVSGKDYAEINNDPANAYSHAMNALSGTTDGYMDDVHELREWYQAHMVVLMVETSGSCGKARLGPTKHYLFAVVRSSCATDNLSFAHEVAHLLGSQHDKGTANNCDDAVAYNFGYRDPASRFRTVMAFDCTVGQCDNMDPATTKSCTRVSRFSSASSGSLYNGYPVSDGVVDNVRWLNERRAEICGYYTCAPDFDIASVPTPSPTVTMAPTYVEELGGECLVTYDNGRVGSSDGIMGTFAVLQVHTDAYGEDTSWTLMDMVTSEIVAYHDIRSYFDDTLHTRFICVPNGPLEFTINDDWRDGLNDPGFYALCVDTETNCISGGGSNGFKDRETQILERIASFESGPPSYGILVSYSPDRLSPFPLDGANVTGQVYIFVTPTDNVALVQFSINGISMSTEGAPPYDFVGTYGDLTAVPWDSNMVRDNVSYTVTAEISFTDGTSQTLSASFTTSNNQSAYAIMASTNRERTNAVPLNLATIGVDDEIYIFTGPDDGVNKVFFFLDGERFKTEGRAPFDAGGTNARGKAKPFFPPTGYKRGTLRVMEAVMTLNDGTEETLSALFLYQ